MNKGERYTQYWPDTTPAKVGPGSYNIEKRDLNWQSAVPFSHAQKRSLTVGKNESFPGPGHYMSPPSHKPSGISYKKSSPRSSPFPSQRLAPGPGAYEVDILQKRPRAHLSRPLAMPVDPTPVSIPTKPPESTELSPVTYSPEYVNTKPSVKAVSFGRPVLKPRKLPEPTVGPGHYTPQALKKDKRKSWFFYSNAKRIAFLEDEKRDSPGPGQYDYSVVLVRERIKQDAFGSATERNIPLSHDPHRPFVTRQSAGPPVGYYFSKEQLERIDELRQKYVAPKIVPAKPGFGSSVDRFSHAFKNQLSGSPGPGAYFDLKNRTNERNTRSLLD